MMTRILAKGYLWLLLALLYSPILIIMIFSFTEAKVLGNWTGFSTKLYSSLFTGGMHHSLMNAIWNTFAIAELLTMNNIKLFGTTVQENIYNGMWNYGAALSLIMLLLIGVTILFTNEEDGASNESGGVI